jgi:hypothetical protein
MHDDELSDCCSLLASFGGRKRQKTFSKTSEIHWKNHDSLLQDSHHRWQVNHASQAVLSSFECVISLKSKQYIYSRKEIKEKEKHRQM